MALIVPIPVTKSFIPSTLVEVKVPAGAPNAKENSLLLDTKVVFPFLNTNLCIGVV